MTDHHHYPYFTNCYFQLMTLPPNLLLSSHTQILSYLSILLVLNHQYIAIIILEVMILLIKYGASFYFLSFLILLSSFTFLFPFFYLFIWFFSSIYHVINLRTDLNNSDLLAYWHHYSQNLHHINSHYPPLLILSTPIIYLNYFNQNHLHINYLISRPSFSVLTFSIFYYLFWFFVLVMIVMIQVANLSIPVSYI